MPKLKLRFGEVETDESIPSMDAIAQEIDSNGIFGYEGERRGVSTEADDAQYDVGDDYIFARFVGEVTEERKEISDGIVSIGESNIARVMRFLLTRDGSYAFETTSGVYDEDALDYLIGEDSFDIDFQCNRYNRFTREQMKEFYTSSFRVRGVQIEEIGDRQPDNHSVQQDVAEYVENAGENAVRAVFSTGSQDNNLKGAEIVDGFSRLSDVNYIRMKDSEGQISEANSSGRYVMSHPADLTIPEQGERVRDVMSTVTSGLTQDDE
ncbi:hypothetical protein [Haloarcula sp. JP-Z28]|uniref:hypothetical protein n=1 Tax=Haloarcula sp. JP-Z28 TaxID=2716715 RepID=UPI001F0477AE|nr:hypothetical protein [Haloarcula sp. JP-Z28]